MSIETLRLAADVVSAFITNRPMLQEQTVLEMLGKVDTRINELLVDNVKAAPANHPPAVPVSKSVTPDAIICLEDGKHLKMLKRYLRSRYGLSPEEYRRKWSLPPDYPMVAPNYAARRSDFAKKIGLGKPGAGSKKAGKR